MIPARHVREPETRAAEASGGNRIPWEERSTLGHLRGFSRTLTLSVREPTRFYSLAPRDTSPLAALAYGLAFDLPVALLGFAYQKAIGEAAFRDSLAGVKPALEAAVPRAPELIEKALGASALVSLVLAPVSYVFEVVVTASVTWIGLRLTGNLRTSFGTLVRLFAYASWIRLIGLLGVTGDLFLSAPSSLLMFGLGSYYWLVIVRQSQQIDTRRAIYASLAGGLVALAFACVVGVPAVVALIAWAVSSIDLPKISP